MGTRVQSPAAAAAIGVRGDDAALASEKCLAIVSGGDASPSAGSHVGCAPRKGEARLSSIRAASSCRSASCTLASAAAAVKGARPLICGAVGASLGTGATRGAPAAGCSPGESVQGESQLEVKLSARRGAGPPACALAARGEVIGTKVCLAPAGGVPTGSRRHCPIGEGGVAFCFAWAIGRRDAMGVICCE